VPNIESRCNQLKLGHPPFPSTKPFVFSSALIANIVLSTWVPELFARESGLPRRLRQPEIVWVAPLSQKLAQPRNAEEFL
jgi:hypothetical protein